MFILHGVIHDDLPLMWAETNDTQELKLGTKIYKKLYKSTANPAQLRKILRSMGIQASTISPHYLSIPSLVGKPIPSSELIESKPRPPKKKIKMNDYMVYAASFSESVTLDLLAYVFNKRAIGPGMLVGADIAYIAEVMRFASSIVARQQYLPGIDMLDQSYSAKWRPILTDEDLKSFDEMASRIPLSVLASLHSMNSISDKLLSEILMKILSSFVEILVRVATKESKEPLRARRNFDSAHDSWMHLLRRNGGFISGPGIKQLPEQIQEWQRPIDMNEEMPLRICFRLEEPQTQHDVWFVRYMVQSRQDPSLLVSLDAVWKAKSKTFSKVTGVKEFIMMSLGYASGIFTPIATNRDEDDYGLLGCTINTLSAHDFLTRDAVALQQAGYGVILPSWWTGRGTKARIRARANIKSSSMTTQGVFSLDNLVQFDWKVSLGNHNMTIAELQALADAKVPLVNVRGKWIEVSPNELKQSIEFLKKRSKKSSLLDAIMMGIGATQDSDLAPGATQGIDIEVASNDKVISQMLDRLTGKTRLEQKDQPTGFEGALRPYQLQGFSWLGFLQKMGLGGCLADDMGLGKTIQILALAEECRCNGDGPFLLICPTSVISNWHRESAKFTPNLSVAIHHGSDRSKSISALKKVVAKCDMLVSSYGLLQRDIDVIGKIKWGAVILDEAQNIKNSNTKQSKAARSIDTRCKFALTGTPVENNIGDLWSIMEFLNPGILGNQASFKRNFFIPIQTTHDEQATIRLRRITGPFILRRLKTDKSIISDLPDKLETKTYCQLTKEQASLYAAVLQHLENSLTSHDGIKRKGLILATLTKLKQVCDHPEILLKDNSGIKSSGRKAEIRSGKLVRLTEMLEETIESYESALVFTQFVDMGHMLQRHISQMLGCEVLFLHGGSSRIQRDAMIKKFQDESTGPKVFVISLKAGGTGLNLTAASHVFHFDRWWNPAVENQATDRAFRIGQKKNVQVHKMICAGTLEEKIDAMIEQKTTMAEKVIGTGEGWITEMSDEELHHMLALSKDALVEDGS